VLPGINSDPVDPGLLRANPIYSRLPVETLSQLIDDNREAKSRPVLYSHTRHLTQRRAVASPKMLKSIPLPA
jgi:hypothetical protein